MYMPSLGERLKAARTAAGFTQKDVEARLGLRDLSLKDYETERIKLPAQVALKFAELYGITVDELLGTAGPRPKEGPQSARLAEVSGLFSRGDVGLLFLDPVIRAHLEEHSAKIFDHSIFELLSLSLNAKAKRALGTEILRSLSSLMGVDQRITPEENEFLRQIIRHLDCGDAAKGIIKYTSVRYRPEEEVFRGHPEQKHLLLWLLFLIAKSDGGVNADEILYIEECAEALKVNRSNYLFIKKFFVKEKY
ncbi:MAG: XRE family transcriptional regulator [Proteobacteria bacterium]|nr:MAG: XRE family transcriptional regulator [Pseudomonadota bacterium]